MEPMTPAEIRELEARAQREAGFTKNQMTIHPRRAQKQYRRESTSAAGKRLR